jgi:HK97 family phage portal protein
MSIRDWFKPKTENRSLSVGPSTAVGLPYGGLATNLSAETAMKLSAVYRCVDVRSDAIASMPWDVFVYNRSKEWVKEEFHFSYDLLNSEPNPSMSKFDFMKTLASMVDLNGNGFVQIIRDSLGNPIRLILLSGEVTMYIKDDYSVYYESHDTYTSRSEMIAGEDMIHVKNFSYDGLLGVSTLTHAGNITTLAASSDGQAKGFFSSGANLSGIISVPGKIDAQRAALLKKSWGETFSLNSTGIAGGVAVMEGGAEFKSVQVNPKDAQMIETRQFNVIDICRFFGVHPSKAFDLTASTYSNVESYQLGFLTDTMTPFKKKFENEFNRKLFRPSQRRKTRLSLDINELLSSDLDTQANYYSKMVQCGAFTPNEIRRKVKQPLIPDGDSSYVQANMVPVGERPLPEQNKNS